MKKPIALRMALLLSGLWMQAQEADIEYEPGARRTTDGAFVSIAL